jgi:hypothetical protein
MILDAGLLGHDTGTVLASGSYIQQPFVNCRRLYLSHGLIYVFI